MTLSQLKSAYKKACRASNKAKTRYMRLLSRLYVRDRNTGERVNAAQACLRADGDIYYVTSYATHNFDNRIFTVARRRGNTIYLAVAGESIWQEAERLQQEMRKAGNATIDTRLALLDAGLTVNETNALREEALA